MKNILAIYLKKKQLTRSDLLKSGAITERQLAKISMRDPDKYSKKMVELLAVELNIESEKLLAELKTIRDSDELYAVTNTDELRQMVSEQEEAFLVRGYFRELMKEIKQSGISEPAELGFAVGAGGLGSLATHGILRVMNFFEEDSQLENLKQDIAQLYTIEFINKEEAKLRLKQLDY
ncbi:XRE family transcriptional regulator [Enterococcus malodoratus]|uniref:XRE family transcriptional regulator n=1 Tax=Enterococcus malodoratus TaxID=71451 RepID=UPI002072E1EE|nr:XRE family transcriptional regulator [Enterococcus malodoratus]